MISRRLKISVRVLMLLIVLVAAALAWQMNKVRRQREAVAAVYKFGGWVLYDHEFLPQRRPVGDWAQDCYGECHWGTRVNRDPWAPIWLRRPLGDEPFQTIADVGLFGHKDIPMVFGNAAADAGASPDEAMAKLVGETGIKSLCISSGVLTDRALESLAQMMQLEELIISHANSVTEHAMATIARLPKLRLLVLIDPTMTIDALRTVGRLHMLEHLAIDIPRVSDGWLQPLAELRHLKSLSVRRRLLPLIRGPCVTDAGIAALVKMEDLESLHLDGCEQVTDRGLEQLRSLKKLKDVWLRGASISEEGQQRFKVSMPNLTRLKLSL